MTDTKKTLAQELNEITTDMAKVQAGFKALGWTIFADLLPGDKFRDNTGADMVKLDDTRGTIKHRGKVYTYNFASTDSVKKL